MMPLGCNGELYRAGIVQRIWTMPAIYVSVGQGGLRKYQCSGEEAFSSLLSCSTPD